MNRRELEGCAFSRLRQLAEARGLPPHATLSSREELIDWLLAHPALAAEPSAPAPPEATRPARVKKRVYTRADPSLDGKCKCGCGGDVKPGNGYIDFHYQQKRSSDLAWERIRAIVKQKQRKGRTDDADGTALPKAGKDRGRS